MQLPLAKNWSGEKGASPHALRALVNAAAIELPMQYLDLLNYSNGGEGPLPPPLHTLCLDKAETAADPEWIELCNRLYPDRFVFGGDGGSILYAFDLSGGKPWRIVSFDSIDSDDSLAVIAPDFESFVGLMRTVEAG